MEQKAHKKVETILLTGALGYIGSHCAVSLYDFIQKEAVQLTDTQLKILIIDDLSNCRQTVLNRINKIVRQQYGDEKKTYFDFIQCNILEFAQLEKIFKDRSDANEKINYIIHFAGKKAVAESVEKPLLYYETNVAGSLNVLKLMEKYKCRNFLFSSSATLYSGSKTFDENSAVNPINPYAETKMVVEMMMKAHSHAYKDACFFALRYFNPAGCHPSGLIGDAPTYPNNLFPIIEQVVIGKREKLYVYGNDYNTPDGSGIRDYIHVMDLVEGHIAAMKKMISVTGYHIYNLGTGKGTSVLELVKTYSKVIGKQIPYEIAPRRDGDADISQATVDKANKELNWKATRTLEQVCQDSWNFIQKNPNGIVN